MAQALDAGALRLCIELARQSLEAGDSPFGSVLLDASGQILHSDRNRCTTGENGDFRADATLHPELTLVRWAQRHLTPEQCASSTVYTSGEHCPMCAAAHAYAGMGRIVYISSTAQFEAWMAESGIKSGTISPLSINQVAPRIATRGPIPELDMEVKSLHITRWQRQSESRTTETST